jgi:hypothetical protein
MLVYSLVGVHKDSTFEERPFWGECVILARLWAYCCSHSVARGPQPQDVTGPMLCFEFDLDLWL